MISLYWSSEAAARQCLSDAKRYLEPVFKAARGKQNGLAAKDATAWRPYSAFVVSLSRISSSQITADQPPLLMSAVMQLASLGLTSLSLLRNNLKGKLYEVEVQRYMLVRKLVCLHNYSDAAQQAWLLYTALCCKPWQPASNTAPIDAESMQHSAQRLPEPDTSSHAEVSSLIVGTVLNLLLSVIEQGCLQSEEARLMTIVHDYRAVVSWIR